MTLTAAVPAAPTAPAPVIHTVLSGRKAMVTAANSGIGKAAGRRACLCDA